MNRSPPFDHRRCETAAYTGVRGSTSSICQVKPHKTDVVFTTTQDLVIGEGLTIDLRWPKGIIEPLEVPRINSYHSSITLLPEDMLSVTEIIRLTTNPFALKHGFNKAVALNRPEIHRKEVPIKASFLRQ